MLGRSTGMLSRFHDSGMNVTLSTPPSKQLISDKSLSMAGYERTKVGNIPHDWTVSCIGAEFSIQLGKMLDASKNTGVPKPYIGNRSVQWGRFELDSIFTVPMTSLDLQRYRLKRGDLLVCEGGEIGRAAIWDDSISECYFQKAIHRLRPLGTYDTSLVMFLLQMWASNGFLAKFVTQTSIAHLPKERLELVPLPVPPPDEQREISAALSHVDGLLAALEGLVAKKRAIKHAAMQQLLTGEARLPGFNGPWTTKTFGEIATIRNEKVQPSNVDASTPCVELDHIEQANGKLLEFVSGQDSTSTKYRFYTGDVLFGRLRPYLRKFWHADRDGICTTEIWPIMAGPQKADGKFVHAIIQSDRFVEAASISYGTHMPRADWSVVQNLEVNLPQDGEQRAISAVFCGMDDEIDALERRRDKTLAIKQGMMEQLLTGRVRLV